MRKGQKRAASSLESNQEAKRPRKWTTRFSHIGPHFPPPYESIHPNFLYNGKLMKLAKDTEEIAVMYGRYLCRNKRLAKNIDKKLQQNFFNDWRSYMTANEQKVITKFELCDFSQQVLKLKQIADEKKPQSKSEKEKREAEMKKYKTVHVDDRVEKVNNCTVEPPGLYMGRGKDNADIGRVKPRIRPEDITINIDYKNRAKAKAPDGHSWGAIVHNNSVMWLASWKDSISGHPKYIQLHASSKIKNDREAEKFQRALELKREIEHVRAQYQKDLGSTDVRTRQIATAAYLIDHFALRVGNEKPEGSTDTVGCCSLRVEHIKFLEKQKNQKKDLDRIRLNFLGKDSIPYDKELLISKIVRDNLQAFMNVEEGKKGKGVFLFDLINVMQELYSGPKDLNAYLANLMPGLTAKVFRTFKATQYFQEKLAEYSADLLKQGAVSADDIKMKVIVFKKANLAVAKLLNHQNLSKPGGKGKGKAIKNHEKRIKVAEDNLKSSISDSSKRLKWEVNCNILKKELELKQELQTYALGTSKTNYIDPAITVAWCEKYGVPIEKVYSKTQRDKFSFSL